MRKDGMNNLRRVRVNIERHRGVRCLNGRRKGLCILSSRFLATDGPLHVLTYPLFHMFATQRCLCT